GRPSTGRKSGVPPRTGLGGHLPLLPLCHLHQRPLAGGGRCQLAASPHRATTLHPHPPAAQPASLRRTGRPSVEGRYGERIQLMSALTEAGRKLVTLEVDGPIAAITNNRPEKHNAMSDEMDRRLFEVLAEVHDMPELRAIVWRGRGKSFFSRRDSTQNGG